MTILVRIGIRIGRGTSLVELKLSNYQSFLQTLLTKWLDERSAIDLSYLDFLKAFQSVDNRLLLAKPKGYGIDPIVIS